MQLWVHSVLDVKINKTHAKRAFSPSSRKDCVKKGTSQDRNSFAAGEGDTGSGASEGEEESEQSKAAGGDPVGRPAAKAGGKAKGSKHV